MFKFEYNCGLHTTAKASLFNRCLFFSSSQFTCSTLTYVAEFIGSHYHPRSNQDCCAIRQTTSFQVRTVLCSIVSMKFTNSSIVCQSPIHLVGNYQVLLWFQICRRFEKKIFWFLKKNVISCTFRQIAWGHPRLTPFFDVYCKENENGFYTSDSIFRGWFVEQQKKNESVVYSNHIKGKVRKTCTSYRNSTDKLSVSPLTVLLNSRHLCKNVELDKGICLKSFLKIKFCVGKGTLKII